MATYADPTTITEAWGRDGAEGDLWRKATDEEVDWLVSKGVVVPVHKKDYMNHNVLNCGWVFKMKTKAGVPTCARGRFVPKGCGQVMGMDVHPDQVASPVARQSSIKMLFSIVVNQSLYTRVIDIRKAFFSGPLDEVVLSKLAPGYRENPKYAVHGKDTLWLYKFAAYGLIQASNRFNKVYSDHLKSCGYTQLKTCVCTFVRRDGDALFIMCLWVDDNIIAYSHPHML